MSSLPLSDISYDEPEGLSADEIWTPIAKEATITPPSSLHGFTHSVIEPEIDSEDEISESVEFELACKHCGSDQFYVGGFVVDLEAGKSFFGKTKYETVLAPPHRLKCAHCGETHVLLDPNIHGYEATVGEESTCHTGTPGEDVEEFTEEALSVHISFSYSDSEENEEELRAEAAQVVKPVSNLFDEATITGYDEEGDAIIEYTHELA